MNKLFNAYVKARNKLNPYQTPDLKIWQKYIDMDIDTFSGTINRLQYKSDQLHGIIDKTADINTFFDHKEHNRDCDDFARAWSTWGVGNGYAAQEIIITTKEHVAKKAHVITILEKDGKYTLCNYTPYSGFNSFNGALNFMKDFKSYQKGFIYELGVKA